MLVQVLLLARIPPLDRGFGFDRLTVWHRRNGKLALSLLLVHAAAITTGYAVGDGISLPSEVGRLLSGYPGVITALAGLVMLVAVVVSSLVIVRRRLRYETWYFVHLYTYLAIALAFSHQIATGREFVGDPAARAYWQGLYIATLACVVVFRLGVPAWRNARHGLRVERVIEEAPGVVSIEIGGARLEELKARAGPVLLVALPDPRALVAVAPVLALRRPRRPAAPDHGQGGRRLQRRGDGHPAGHARDLRRAARRVHGGRAAPAPGRADRGRRRHHADPRAARGPARATPATSRSSIARRAKTT